MNASGSLEENGNRRKLRTRYGEEKLSVFDAVIYHFKRPVDCRAYHLGATLFKYDSELLQYVSKIAKQMTAHIKPLTFDSFDLMPILGFRKNFKLICSTNGIHEGEEMWLFHSFLNKSVTTVLNVQLSVDPTDRKSSRQTTVVSSYVTIYQQVVIFLLENYATD